jgi:hypothetical protein
MGLGNPALLGRTVAGEGRIALLSAVYVAVVAASFFLSLTIFKLLD